MRGLQPLPTHTDYPLSSSSSSSSNNIVKSGILYKKTECIMLTKYKKRSIELTTDGELICYEVKANGQKIEKESIILSSTTRIEKRSGAPRARRNAKFIIHLDNKTKWYFWCHNGKSSPKIHSAPITTIYKYSPKSKTNPVNSTIHYNNVLFPYHRYHRHQPSPSIPVGINPLISVNIEPPESHTIRKSSYTSLTSVSFDMKPKESQTSLLPISPIKLNVITSFYDENINNGVAEAQKWCNALNNMIHNMQYTAKQKTFPLNKNSSVDIDYIIDVPWILKQCYMMLKIYRYGYRRNMYKTMYFVLRMNGMLDYYEDATLNEQKGCIDVLNGCINVEKRNGSQKKDCKFVVITESNSFYFWCKNDKSLSMDWYYLIKRIIGDKMKNINEYLKIAESTMDDIDIYDEKQSISLLD